ncbi:DUF5344 family protein, partial [Bacillus altitudinis]|uniref:DUF5344 family protein n=1 Tax=Bacillus altitudinis TaxID=293387 RepID=UPI00119F002C
RREIKIDGSEVKGVLEDGKESGGEMNGRVGTRMKGRNEVVRGERLEKMNEEVKELSRWYIEIVEKEVVEREEGVNTMMERDKAVGWGSKRK